MWRAFKHEYDRENDILYLADERITPRGSLVFGDGKLVLDYGKSDVLASVEILDASKYLRGALGSQAPSPSKLSRVEKARVDVRRQDHIVFLKMMLVLPDAEEPVRLTVQVPQAAKLAS